jgi:5-formaminoimidazole-4-carboxamide-1-beta-D-ribofuranosyl 5'-monophosphate synthetase
MEKKDVVKESVSKKYCIIRTYSAGVFAGYIESRKGQEVVIRDARRIWRWDGGASLSQLAQSGTSKPELCKFPEPVDRITVLEAIEILECSAAGEASIKGVAIWKG